MMHKERPWVSSWRVRENRDDYRRHGAGE